MATYIVPPSVAAFLRKTGWPTPENSMVAERMATALLYFHGQLQKWCDLPLDKTDKGYQKHGFSPYAFRSGAKPTKLTAWMQAINFNMDVSTLLLKTGTYVRRYGQLSERGEKPRGLWYTTKETPASRLALPPGQTTAMGYEVKVPVTVLVSTAGDLLVDWNMTAPAGSTLKVGKDYHYCHGGGTQYVIPDFETVLKTL